MGQLGPHARPDFLLVYVVRTRRFSWLAPPSPAASLPCWRVLAAAAVHAAARARLLRLAASRARGANEPVNVLPPARRAAHLLVALARRSRRRCVFCFTFVLLCRARALCCAARWGREGSARSEVSRVPCTILRACALRAGGQARCFRCVCVLCGVSLVAWLGGPDRARAQCCAGAETLCMETQGL